MLYIARHAWAGSFGDPQWPDDSLRELTASGVERYSRMLEKLADRGFEPELIATSPYVRCRQTAELIAEHVAGQPEIVPLEALTPGSDFPAVCQWSAEQLERGATKSICWVGHAPDVGNFTSALIGEGNADVRFAKGAIAAVALHRPPGYRSGELYWHTTAKLLGV